MNRLHGRGRRQVALALALGVVALISIPPIASSAGGGKKVYYLDLFGQASMRPKAIFLTANTGDSINPIKKWALWGENEAVAWGTYNHDCACPLNYSAKAKLVAHKVISCTPDFGDFEGQKIHIYKYGVVSYTHEGEDHSGRIDLGSGACR